MKILVLILTIVCSSLCFSQDKLNEIDALKMLTRTEQVADSITFIEKGLRWIHSKEESKDCQLCEHSEGEHEITACYSLAENKYGKEACKKFKNMANTIVLGRITGDETSYRIMSYSNRAFDLKKLMITVIVPAKIESSLVVKRYNGDVSVTFYMEDMSVFTFNFEDKKICETLLANTGSVKKRLAGVVVDFQNESGPYVLVEGEEKLALKVNNMDEFLNDIEGYMIGFQSYTPVDGWFMASGTAQKPTK